MSSKTPEKKRDQREFPSAGGHYIRHADGSLKRNPDESVHVVPGSQTERHPGKAVLRQRAEAEAAAKKAKEAKEADEMTAAKFGKTTAKKEGQSNG